MGINSLDKYLAEQFPLLKLKQPLFYNFPVGIRFDLGGNLEISEGRMEQCYKRSYTLFSEINKSSDELFVVVYVDSWDEYPINESEPQVFNIFKKYFYGKDFSCKVIKDKFEYRYKEPEDLDDTKTYRFFVKCRVEEINFKEMIIAKLNQSVGIAPFILGDLYFVNQSRNIIFHIYDDRGLDVISSSKHKLIEIYKKYREWILEYDREKIDQVFV
ncbi:hypothetical protein SPSYN_02689 [Sporotomaculum syntrophicum]|uniref:DUF3885 domain-containing protein n=1 Tax=Sporotomaculum syntrophicum TaxID=182264 RepID=A0A9D2WMS6_9FIRM|nr:DUF3885 domain-containing protein [Sporotomaculum syntrophicum]KAF1084285.1 hypothetical protein SPSYN_02689 [Sporotomaculum syntrophicum]